MHGVVQTAAPSNFASLAMEGSTGSVVDKKRNKLGYHRTSVACVHCRRRKIRCLLAPGDHQGRCENCIRLKKECHFFPVDQQPPIDKKGRAGPKAELASADAAVTTPPPIMGHGTNMDQKDSYFQYSTMPMNQSPAISPYEPAPIAGTAISTFSSDPMMSHDPNAVTPQITQPVTWEDPSLYNNRIASGVTVDGTINPSPGNGWSQSPTTMIPFTTASPITSASNNPAMALVSPHPLQAAAYGAGQEGTLWNAQPGRAMTMPGHPPEPTSVQYPSQLAPNVNPDFKRPPMTVPAEGYPGSMASPAHSNMPSSIPVSYSSQSSPVGYDAWNSNLPPNPGMPPPIQNRLGMGPTPEPVPGWYPTGPDQYNQMKQDDMAVLASQGHLMDPSMLQHLRKPG